MKNENMVAKILKYYGWINGIANVILAIIIGNALKGTALSSLWVISLAAGIVVSFGIYAFGEVIQLLQDIKNNSAGKVKPNEEELPEI